MEAQPRATLPRSTQSIQTETKTSVRQPQIHAEAQLAVPLKDKNFDPLKVVLISKDLMDQFEFPHAQNDIGLAFLQMPTEFLKKPTDRAAFDGEAFKYFRLAAENDNKEGQNNLGFAYENGRGVDQNMASAVKWYQKAADQGLEVAKSNLEPRFSIREFQGE